MQDQMTGAAMAMPPDPNKAFKVSPSSAGPCGSFRRSHTRSVCLRQSEWEALEIVEHKWALEKVEEELMAGDLNFGGSFSRDASSAAF